jgi:biopolymer transport protein ExbD
VAVSLREKSGSGGQASIPTASMGDIAFLITIFFMSTSMFAKEKGLKIVLPEKGETKVKAENILQVAVSSSGQVRVGDEVVEIPAVRDQIMKRLAANESLAVALRVSPKAPYRVMVEVFDQLKLAKADRISLMPVRKEDEGGAP